MIYPVLIILGIAPSIIWLLFYLRKDAHPESNRMILKIFFYGTVAAVIAALIEIAISFGLSLSFSFFGQNLFKILALPFFLFYNFIVIALVEELSKFLIVKEKVINNPEFDEPVDAMLYMIIAALGFAALENILVLFSGTILIQEALLISSFRFIGATFLHALCSGTLGYFLALSFFNPEKRSKLIIKGIVIATGLHGFFNVSIIGIEKGLFDGNRVLVGLSIVLLIMILTSLAIFVSFGFKKLKKIASVCKVK